MNSPSPWSLRARMGFALLLLACATGASAQRVGKLTLIDGKPILIRGAVVHAAPEGLALEEGDILETDAKGLAQIEFVGGPTFALGGQTKILLSSLPPGGTETQMAAITGWVKFAQRKSGGGELRLQAPGARLAIEDATGVLHVGSDSVEVFVEAGSLKLTETGKKGSPGDVRVLKAGDFAVRKAEKAVVTENRPAPDFVAAMPRAFRDNLPKRIDRFKDRKAEPKPDHEVTAEEIAPWLQASASINASFTKRLEDRAKDPEFRKALAENLRGHPELGPVPGADTAKKDPAPPVAAAAPKVVPAPAASAKPASQAAAKASREAPASQAAAPVAATPSAASPPAVAPAPQEGFVVAARDVFGKAQLPTGQTLRSYTPVNVQGKGQGERDALNVVIDPLLDGITGAQTAATVGIGKQLSDLVAKEFPNFRIKPMSAANLADMPLVVIGTFTPVAPQGKGPGEGDAYRTCFALVDLKSKVIVGKGDSRARVAGVNPTPLPYYQDAPLWMSDPAVEGYVATCQGTKIGDPIHPAYLEKVLAVAAINEATSAYNNKRYAEALVQFTSLLRSPAGDQPRVHTGIYLSNLRLGQREAAMQAFSTLARQGLGAKRLAVKLNFQKGGASLANDGNPYDLWIKELALQAAKITAASSSCIEVGGHARQEGSEVMNKRISLQRAEFVRQRLIAEQSDLAAHLTAAGYGSAQALSATGRAEASNLLDRRIELKSTPCS